MKQLIWSVLNFLGIGPAVQLGINSGLKADGWNRTYISKRSETRSGEPLAWYTYPFLHFLEPRLGTELSVFEYGAGASTLWYAKRCKQVTAVEHHEGWVAQIKAQMPANAEVHHRPIGEAYIQAARELGGGAHDIIVVDGRERVACARGALDALTDRGVIIFDNTERERYQDVFAELAEAGFRQLRFHGMAPVNPLNTETSVFYRPDNCLGI
jgi:hypothetical protein